MLGPNVQLLTPLHPLDPDERNSGLEYGSPITIGDNFWAGGGVTILPGVTLGNNVVGDAGSVVTKSLVIMSFWLAILRVLSKKYLKIILLRENFSLPCE